MVTTVKFAKVRPDAIIPTKRNEDAGFDIYPCFEEDYIIIQPHATVMIPTGIAAACDSDYYLSIRERGSTGMLGLSIRSGVVDSGYRGEIFVVVTNISSKKLVIQKKNKEKGTFDYWSDDNVANKYPYEKAIAQLIVTPVPMVDVEEYTYEELQAIPSERGNGSLGSSGK